MASSSITVPNWSCWTTPTLNWSVHEFKSDSDCMEKTQSCFISVGYVIAGLKQNSQLTLPELVDQIFASGGKTMRLYCQTAVEQPRRHYWCNLFKKVFPGI